MKYSYHMPVTYTRGAQQYTPAQYTPTSHHISSSHLYSSAAAVAAKYAPATHYSPSHYAPSSPSSSSYSSYSASLSSHYTPSYKSASFFTSSSSSSPSSWSSSSSSSYVPSSYTRGSRCSTRRGTTPETPVTPARAVMPAAKRAVHFPNDIVFQDIVRRGDMEQIGRFMRARKVRVDTLFHSGMAALHEAVLSGNLETVKLLVKYGADVHQRDVDGWTPLHMACSDGFPEIARYLLSAGASAEVENESGEKPSDLIDPECKELAKLFETGCI